ncbi:MAG TPA: DUF1223 domain-containing protein [Gammaproteobacteria bacterium]
MPKFRLLAALSLLVAANAADAAPLQFTSPPTRATLVELYTSEGCSSCPPADRWLSGLRDDPRLWRELVPVAFHVDYWDAIGWPDRFARAEYSRRQRDYAAQGLLGSVYTPGLVVAGREWRGWFRRPQLQLAAAVPAGLLQLEVDGERVTARYRPAAAEATTGALTLHLARLGFDLESRVSAGENRGATLRHDFVVLGHASVPLQPAGGRFAAESLLPPASTPSARQAVAAWVSGTASPEPLQALGGWLHR